MRSRLTFDLNKQRQAAGCDKIETKETGTGLFFIGFICFVLFVVFVSLGM